LQYANFDLFPEEVLSQLTWRFLFLDCRSWKLFQPWRCQLLRFNHLLKFLLPSLVVYFHVQKSLLHC